MRRKTALPRWLQHGIARAERERKANVIARPMRNLMDMLKQGEVYEIDGRAVMRMPEIDEHRMRPTRRPVTQAQADAWHAFERAMGNDAYAVEYPSVAEIADAVVDLIVGAKQ